VISRVGLRVLVSTACAVILLLCAPVKAAPPPPVLDQSFTSPSGGAGIINECCSFVAQTFTAGRDGVLAGVNIETYDATVTEPDAPLRVAIRDVVNGAPGQTILAETVLPSETVPLSQLITFPQMVQLRSGVRYAIVVNLEDPFPTARAGWVGATGDAYPRGDECASLNDGLSWFCYDGESEPFFDLHFQTYVTPPPTSKDECKNGGWRAFGFENQGQCVAFVRHKAREACIFERAAHGVAAFRAKYGIGPQQRLAMRHCVHRRIGS
jgi:hypothetical protein